VAEEVSRRHEAIRLFLVDVLAVDPAAADENACRMEHAMDSDVADRLLRFMEFVKQCPCGGEDRIQAFRHFCEENPQRQHEEPGIEECRADERGDRAEQDQEGKGTMTTLDQLKPGEKAKIVRVGGKGGVARRIADMGVVRGTPVEVMRVAPLGDPIQVKVKGYDLSLRKEEAAAIRVEQS
jgi:DtxR family Mn-dependent transcriptional regulator